MSLALLPLNVHHPAYEMAFILHGGECQAAAIRRQHAPRGYVALYVAGCIGLQLGVPRLLDLRRVPSATHRHEVSIVQTLYAESKKIDVYSRSFAVVKPGARARLWLHSVRYPAL
jgi:hypothetical protein